jgi:hypothetical protein
MSDFATALVFVNGTAMKGGVLAPNLSNAEFLGEVATASRYRFFSVRDEFPGLLRDDANGTSVAGELYRVDVATVAEVFLPDEPPELEFSLICLSDGSYALGMVLRPGIDKLPESTEITVFGGWRAYLKSLDASAG